MLRKTDATDSRDNSRSHALRRALMLSILCCGILANAAEDQWTRFRGPDGSGISSAQNLPVSWTESDASWKVSLPGLGYSSPVIWQDRIYLTSGDEKTADRYILCFQISDGKKLWEKKYPSKTHIKHLDSSYGSSSPCVDADGVYVYWATPEAINVVALSLDGEEKWIKNLGPYPNKFGSGMSPVVVDHQVWINNDQDGPSALFALDTKTGEIKHKIDRRVEKVCYGTPCLLRSPGKADALIFAASSHGLTSIDPQTGKVNWDCTNLFKSRIVSSPIYSDGLVVCSSGEGGVGRRLVAVRPPTDDKPAEVVYDFKTGINYVPTPLARDGRLYIIVDNGLIRCLQTATGKALWQQKLDEEFYGSPVWAQNRLYVTSKNGTVYVIAAGDTYELLGKNPLGEPSFATPAIAQETLFFRTHSHLIAVRNKKPQT